MDNAHLSVLSGTSLRLSADAVFTPLGRRRNRFANIIVFPAACDSRSATAPVHCCLWARDAGVVPYRASPSGISDRASRRTSAAREYGWVRRTSPEPIFLRWREHETPNMCGAGSIRDSDARRDIQIEPDRMMAGRARAPAPGHTNSANPAPCNDRDGRK